MIKVVYCLRKKWGLTDAEFARYYSEVNGPLLARIPGLRRAVQSQALTEENLDFEYDAMTELWFDELSALNRASASSEWARSMADSSNFIDPATTAYFVVRERELPLPDLAAGLPRPSGSLD